MTRAPRRAFYWAFSTVLVAGLSVWACSNTSKEQLEAAGLAKGCTLSSDCNNPLVCVFQLCHDECHTTEDCILAYGKDSGARCVSSGEDDGQGGAGGQSSAGGTHGVCTFPKSVVEANQGTKGIDSSCTTDKDCVGAEHCALDNQCRDGCGSDADCLNGQVCALSRVCADKNEVDTDDNLVGNAGAPSTDGTGGTGGKGGTVTGSGGEAGGGDTVVNECPDTSTMNPIEHSYETITAPETWNGFHHVSTGLTVNAALTLAPCAVVKFDTNAYIVVNNNGSLKALGTATNPVVFSSDKTVPKKGDWAGIDIQQDASNDSELKNVIIEYAGDGYGYGRGALQLDGEAAASFENVTVRHTGDNYCAIGLQTNSEPAAFDGIRIEDSKSGLCIGSDVIGSIGSLTSDVPISVDTQTITSPGIWQSFGVPYRFDGSLSVNAKLTLAAGVTIQMPANTYVSVDNGGSLITQGTTDAPVTFTSAKDSPGAGDWDAISFGANSSNDNMLTNTVVQYGGSGDASIHVYSHATAGFSGVTVSDSADGPCAIQIDGTADISDFEDVTFENDTCPLAISSTEVGSLQSLTADGGYIQVNNDTIIKAVTWSSFGIPYRLTGSMNVQAALSLDPGVEIQLPKNGYIAVSANGAIKATGTSKQHITFESALDGPMPGDWTNLSWGSDAAGTSTFSYADFIDGGGDRTGTIYINGRNVSFDHCTFTDDYPDDDTGGCDYTATGTGGKFVDKGDNASNNPLSMDGTPDACM